MGLLPLERSFKLFYLVEKKNEKIKNGVCRSDRHRSPCLSIYWARGPIRGH